MMTHEEKVKIQTEWLEEEFRLEREANPMTNREKLVEKIKAVAAIVDDDLLPLRERQRAADRELDLLVILDDIDEYEPTSDF